jgi:hypothetical protein
MGQYAITPSDPKLQAMFTLTVHQSLGDGIVAAGALRQFHGELTEADAHRLEDWAAFHCENPHGQRAAFARTVAGLIRLAGGVRCDWIGSAATEENWDHLGR